MSLTLDHVGAPNRGRHGAFTGTGILLRFAVRRDLVRMLAWIGGICVLVVLTVASIKGLYPTQADLDEAAAAAKGNAAAIAFNGPAVGLETVGGEVAFNMGAFGLVLMGLMSLLMVGRLTRGEEEAGRLEMLRALPVGRGAPTAAALVAVASMNVVAGAAVTTILVAEGLPAGGSVVFGLSFTLLGLLVCAIAMAASEMTDNTRVVYGSTGALLGASFLLRAVGDVGDGTISWLSPIGWAQKTRPFAGDKLWPLAFLIVSTVVVSMGARHLAARRDLGSGLIPPRPGRPNAAPGLRNPFGVALRLQRGSLVGWGLGVLVMAVAYGSIAPTIDEFIGHNKALADMFAAGHGSLTDTYFATSIQIVALIGAGFAIQSALRLRSEETALRAEPLLATPVSRQRWALSHLAVAFGGTMVLLVVAGLGMGVSYAVAGGSMAATPDLLAAALAYIPAVWVMLGVAFALVGLMPRAIIVAWLALVLCLVISLLGQLLRLSQWVRDLSPFDHVPRLPAADARLVPITLLLALTAGLWVAGMAGLRRRDIG